MIQVEGLTKLFRKPSGLDEPAVEDLNFSVKPGEVFGLLGPNGAGKTTTLRMLCTLLKPSAGFASIAEHDIVEQPALVRANIGFVSANTGVYDRMTAWEMVEYYGKLYGMSGDSLRLRLETLFGKLQMHDFRNVPGGQLSTGMKQKVSIARAIVHNPQVLIFDEPTAGLDILVQRAVMQSIQELRDQGKTILFSTHIMREVEKLCDRVAIMAKGRIVAMGSLAELRQQYQQHDLEELFFSLVS
jgi:sodium transport system ATP-binding protein